MFKNDERKRYRSRERTNVKTNKNWTPDKFMKEIELDGKPKERGRNNQNLQRSERRKTEGTIENEREKEKEREREKKEKRTKDKQSVKKTLRSTNKQLLTSNA